MRSNNLLLHMAIIKRKYLYIEKILMTFWYISLYLTKKYFSTFFNNDFWKIKAKFKIPFNFYRLSIDYHSTY